MFPTKKLDKDGIWEIAVGVFAALLFFKLFSSIFSSSRGTLMSLDDLDNAEDAEHLFERLRKRIAENQKRRSDSRKQRSKRMAEEEETRSDSMKSHDDEPQGGGEGEESAEYAEYAEYADNAEYAEYAEYAE